MFPFPSMSSLPYYALMSVFPFVPVFPPAESDSDRRPNARRSRVPPRPRPAGVSMSRSSGAIEAGAHSRQQRIGRMRVVRALSGVHLSVLDPASLRSSLAGSLNKVGTAEQSDQQQQRPSIPSSETSQATVINNRQPAAASASEKSSAAVDDRHNHVQHDVVSASDLPAKRHVEFSEDVTFAPLQVDVSGGGGSRSRTPISRATAGSTSPAKAGSPHVKASPKSTASPKPAAASPKTVTAAASPGSRKSPKKSPKQQPPNGHLPSGGGGDHKKAMDNANSSAAAPEPPAISAAQLARENQRKMFEPSPAMLQAFPLAASESQFAKVSHSELTDANAFKRVNLLERERRSGNEPVGTTEVVTTASHAPPATESAFARVPDHAAAAARATSQAAGAWPKGSRAATQAAFQHIPDQHHGSPKKKPPIPAAATKFGSDHQPTSSPSRTRDTQIAAACRMTSPPPLKAAVPQQQQQQHTGGSPKRQQIAAQHKEGAALREVMQQQQTRHAQYRDSPPSSLLDDRHSYLRQKPLGGGFGGGGGGGGGGGAPKPAAPSQAPVHSGQSKPEVGNGGVGSTRDCSEPSTSGIVFGDSSDRSLPGQRLLSGMADGSSGAKGADGGGGRLFIKGGHVVNDDAMFTADIYIDNGVIQQVAPSIAVPPGVRVLDATGKFVLPGGIDTHTHMQHNFMGATSVDDFAAGTRAALAGGTTTIMDMVYPNTNEPLMAAFKRTRQAADARVCCDYCLSVLVPKWTPHVPHDIVQLTKEQGVNAFVFCMAYGELGIQLRDNELYQAMCHCKQLGAIARIHAENGDVIAEKSRQLLSLGITGPEGHIQARSEELEVEATNRACVLAKQTNCPLYILHVSSRSAAEMIARHRKAGVVVFGEPTSASLATDGTHYFNSCWQHAAGHVTAPPLRPDPSQMGALMDMLSGGELHCVASDHRAHSQQQKQLGQKDFTRIPHGVNGVEERLSIVWEFGVHSGKMDPMKFVAVTSTNAAKIFNLYPKKGRIAAGADADLVVWDSTAKRTVSRTATESQADFNIFEGKTLHGIPLYTVYNGRVAFDQGKVSAEAGSGRFLPLPTHAPFVYSVIQQREKVCVPTKVERDPAASLQANRARQQQSSALPTSPLPAQQQGDFHTRGATRAGGRSAHDSSFSLSGAQYDDEQQRRSQTKISQPPGGKSSGLW